MQSLLNLKSEEKLNISFVFLCQVGLHLLMAVWVLQNVNQQQTM